MNTNMLRAISQMLEKGEEGTLGTRVCCAKIMLDEVILGMEDSVDEGLDLGPVHKVCPTSGQVVSKPKPKPEDYKVVVDADRKLTKIEGLDLDAAIIFDGKTMKHKDAIGKKFVKVSLP